MIIFQDVKIYRAELHKILNTPDGKLWGALHKRGEIVVSRAKKQVGVRTGALRESIYMTHVGSARGQSISIGSRKSYAYMHHEGTKPHTIVAPVGGLLTFNSSRGAVIRTTTVNHPGTRPNRYLSDHIGAFVHPRITIR